MPKDQINLYLSIYLGNCKKKFFYEHSVERKQRFFKKTLYVRKIHTITFAWDYYGYRKTISVV